MNFSNPKLIEILKKAGWKEERDDSSIEKQYRDALGEAWIQEAAPFVRSLGGLKLGKSQLMIYADALNYIGGISVRSRVEAVIGCRCCPVAESWYVGDGGTLWIDSKGRFYFIDSEGMIFLGENVEATLSVLLLPDVKPFPPPEELREALQKAYEWNKPSDPTQQK